MILAKNISEMKRVKDSLKFQFKMKDMVELHYYVGVNIVCKKHVIRKRIKCTFIKGSTSRTRSRSL